MALAENVTNTRPLRISTAGPSFTWKPCTSQRSVGVAMRTGAVLSASGEAISAM